MGWISPSNGRVGPRVFIGRNSLVEGTVEPDCAIGHDTVISEASTVGRLSIIGDRVHIEPGTVFEASARVGSLGPYSNQLGQDLQSLAKGVRVGPGLIFPAGTIIPDGATVTADNVSEFGGAVRPMAQRS